MITVVSLLFACAPQDGAALDAKDDTTPPMSLAVHWVRNSAEHELAVRQAYELATLRLWDLWMETDGEWSVSLDLDETVMDNSTYQKEREAQGLGYDSASWAAWVERREAGILPGVKDFLDLVVDMGGYVAFVTNRKAAECQATEDNLKAEGVFYDAILCRTDTSEKEPRYQMLADGSGWADGVARAPILWVGDNIEDFPELTQEVRHDESVLDAAYQFVVVPNPMYGSFANNPQE